MNNNLEHIAPMKVPLIAVYEPGAGVDYLEFFMAYREKREPRFHDRSIGDNLL